MAIRHLVIVGPIILILFWWGITANGLVNPLFLPQPSETAEKILELFGSQAIEADIWATFYRMIFGFVVATVLGVPVGLSLGASPRLYSALEVVIDFFRSLPSTALFPLFLLVFGIGDEAKIAIVVFVSFWIILIINAKGVVHSSQTRWKVMKIFGGNKWQILTQVIIMEALPQIATGLRVALSISFIVVVVTEMFIGTNVGLGRRIYDAYLTYRIPELYATLVITGLLGYFLNKLFVLTERKLIHWTGK